MKRILLLNEMMFGNGTSYAIRFDTAKELSIKNRLLLISPTQRRNLHSSKIQVNPNFVEIISPGILPKAFRRGGFSILDLFCKIFYVIKFRPEVIYTTSGHRPSQLLPAILGKLLYKTTIIDERWEYYHGRRNERKGFIGSLIKRYDKSLEKRSIPSYDRCIAVSNFLANELNNSNVSFYPGVIDFRKYEYYEITDARKILNLPIDAKIIGLISLGNLDHSDYLHFYSALNDEMQRDSNLFIFCTGEKKYIESEILTRFQNVIYKGWLSERDLYIHLSACNTFALPLNPTERNLGRWPIKFNEFIFFRRKIITSSEHDIGYLFSESDNIITYNNKEIKLLSDKIHNALSSEVNSDHAAVLIDKLSISRKVEFLEKFWE